MDLILDLDRSPPGSPAESLTSTVAPGLDDETINFMEHRVQESLKNSLFQPSNLSVLHSLRDLR